MGDGGGGGITLRHVRYPGPSGVCAKRGSGSRTSGGQFFMAVEYDAWISFHAPLDR